MIRKRNPCKKARHTVYILDGFVVDNIFWGLICSMQQIRRLLCVSVCGLVDCWIQESSVDRFIEPHNYLTDLPFHQMPHCDEETSNSIRKLHT